MKRNTSRWLASLLLVAALGTGCSVLNGGSRLDATTNAVERNVMDRLSRDDLVQKYGLGVRVTEAGEATIYGSVPNSEVSARVRNVVKGTPGVTSVNDRTVVYSTATR